MSSRFVDFFASWFRSWPWRLRCLAGPYFIALGASVAAYVGKTALFTPSIGLFVERWTADSHQLWGLLVAVKPPGPAGPQL